MATINITVQSLLNAAVYDSYAVDDAGTIGELKASIESTTDCSVDWFDLVFDNEVLNTANTIASYGIVEDSQLRTHNKISRLANRELRQKAKLDLASLDRADSGLARTTYDITQLPTQYNDNAIVNNPNIGGLVVGRPWINTVAPFTFYEAGGTTVAISTTKYVSGNKIYALSSTFDVPLAPNARVVVNDIEVLNVGNGVDRGHHLVILDSNGDAISATRYDTFETVVDSGDGGAPGRLALASALNAVASGNIIVLVTYDASSFDATLRSAINTEYGSTNTETWTASRISHIFIGIKQ